MHPLFTHHTFYRPLCVTTMWASTRNKFLFFIRADAGDASFGTVINVLFWDCWFFFIQVRCLIT